MDTKLTALIKEFGETKCAQMIDNYLKHKKDQLTYHKKRYLEQKDLLAKAKELRKAGKI